MLLFFSDETKAQAYSSYELGIIIVFVQVKVSLMIQHSKS